jgi:hypothetical protein
MSIGTLGEKSLHAALKMWYARPGDQIECVVGGYHIDLVRADDSPTPLLVEFQTASFGNMKPKLTKLLPDYRVHLVHPVSVERRIILLDGETGHIVSSRKSPKRGRVEEVFRELVAFPKWMLHPNFTLEVLLVRDEEIRKADGRGSWRRKHQSIADRRLLEVIASARWSSPEDLGALLPAHLPEPFTVRELAAATGMDKPLAGKAAYCLREMNAITLAGRKGKAYVYQRVVSSSPS